MPVPAAAKVFTQPMDPTDLVEWKVNLSRGTADTDVLQPTEDVTSYTLALTTEAITAGLTIRNDGAYVTTLTGTELVFWLEVDASMRSAALFDAGVNLPIELTLNTNNSPPRRRQRTLVVKVINL